MELSTLTATRRGFLAGAAGLACATGAAAMLGGVPRLSYGSETTAQEQQWDMAADFVVIGAGTGQAGAVAAAVEGMSVIILESRRAVGGAMALSGGAAWLPNNATAQQNGDSRDIARTYLLHMQQDMSNLEVMDAFLDNTQNTIDTLAAGGVQLASYPYPIEYHQDWEGAGNFGGRTNIVYGPNGEMGFEDGGQRLNDAFVSACANLGVTVLTQTTGRRLVTRRETSDSVPQVIGVIAQTDDGTTYAIRANRGVLLATGGFDWDEELVANYVRVPLRYFVSYSTNDGGALRMAQSVGADLRMMNEFWGQSVYTKQGEYAKDRGEPVCIACQNERSLPGSIMVDSTGRRFHNEAADYDSECNAYGGYSCSGENGWTCDPCWLVYDNTCYETYNLVGAGQDFNYPVPYIPEEEMIIKADTLEELAELIGVPGEILVRTINEFNEFAAQGIDPIYHRGETMAPISPVTDTLAPLTEPPYRAISVSAGALGTCGGPRLNGNAQVVHISGEPIPGLYACGNCAGVGGPGPAYGGAGGTIGPAIVMAVLAAQHAAAREDVTESESFVPEIEKTYDYELADNEYLGVGRGVGGDIVVKVTVEGGAPTAIEVLEQYETEGVGDVVTQILPEQIVEAGSTQVEAIAGATYTSRGVIEAVNAALTQVQD